MPGGRGNTSGGAIGDASAGRIPGFQKPCAVTPNTIHCSVLKRRVRVRRNAAGSPPEHSPPLCVKMAEAWRHVQRGTMLDMAGAQQVTACIENSAGMCVHSTVSEDACAMHAVVAPVPGEVSFVVSAHGVSARVAVGASNGRHLSS